MRLMSLERLLTRWTPPAIDPGGGGESDESLVAAVQADPGGQHGRNAASRLLGRYQQRVYAWCYRHVRDRDLALDLSQEVLVSAYQNLPGFGQRARFSSWLFAIARNRCLSELRRVRLEHEDEELLQRIADARPGPDRELEDRESEGALLDLIAAHLDPLEQDALWLRCIERMAVDDITRLLDLRDQTGARAVLQRARRKLRAALARTEATDTEAT